MEKTTDLPQATDNRHHIMLCNSPEAGCEITTSVVIGIHVHYIRSRPRWPPYLDKKIMLYVYPIYICFYNTKRYSQL
jgi:hypothetical protein